MNELTNSINAEPIPLIEIDVKIRISADHLDGSLGRSIDRHPLRRVLA